MPQFVILARSLDVADALRHFLGLLQCVRTDLGKEQESIPAVILDDHCTPDSFNEVAEILRRAAYSENGRTERSRVIVLVDHLKPALLNPIGTGGRETLIAMLILVFPELRWICGVFDSNRVDTAPAISGFLNLLTSEQEPLFDPCGLRNLVRHNTNSQDTALMPRSGHSSAPYLPFRNYASAAIDDEASYAYFHSYTSYRFGFRSYLVTTQRQFDYLFSNRGEGDPTQRNILVAFDDLYLNFPDRMPQQQIENTPWQGLSNLRHRTALYPILGKTNHWIFVTTGQRRPGDKEKWADNKTFRRELRENGQHNEMLLKPTSGIFDLWERSGLLKRLPGPMAAAGNAQTPKTRPGYAPGFFWPPSEPLGREDFDDGHSAPGRLLEVATLLIERAKDLLPNVRTIEDAVRGAVFATEALELVGPRTPTTAIEALALKHQFEVIAECQFHGVEYDFDLTKRFDEIEIELEAIRKWFNPETSDRSVLNAQLAIVSRLVVIFRNYNQFDEEQACLNEVRDLHRKTWVRKHPWLWLVWPFRWYFDTLLKSMAHFTVAIAIWLVVLSILYAWSSTTNFSGMEKLWAGFKDAYTSFFPMQPPDETIPPPFGIVALAIIGGFLHLGAFASHLYSKIARK